MTTVVHYGNGKSLELSLADDAVIAGSGGCPSPPVADLQAEVAKSLSEPIEFPGVAQFVVPGDRVALVLGPDVPHAAEIVAEVVRHLVREGAEASHLVIVRSGHDAAAGLGDPRNLLPPQTAESIALITHDPDDRNALGYLGDFSDGTPMLISRAVVDADVVIPIGCFRLEASGDYRGVHAPLFPFMLDRQGQQHGRGTPSEAALAEEVARQLGVLLSIQVIPGAGGSVLHLLGGENSVLQTHCEQLYREAWSRSIERPVSLVIATIQGDASEQTWDRLAKTLAAAARLVEDDGAIAVCCDLDESPGPAVCALLEADTRESALARIEQDQLEDRSVAVRLTRTLERTRVYMMSGLDPALVEDLEMIPLEHERELSRLADRHASCLLLSDAAEVSVTIAGDESEATP